MARVVGVQAPLLGDGDGEPLHPDQFGQRVGVGRRLQAAGRRDVVGQPRGSVAEHPGDPVPPVMLIGPCRYSIAGYASVQAPAASRIFSAGLLGEADGPAAAEEGELLGAGRPAAAAR